MHRPFHPLFRSPHVSTIAGNFWPRQIDQVRFPCTLRYYDPCEGTRILVLEHQPPGAARGQIVFLHGLEGSANAGYIVSMAQAALERGFGVHRCNLRTCGGTGSLSRTMYHSGLTADTRFLLERLHQTRPGPVFLAGFSLGGNVTLKLAGELGATDLLAGACAVSTPIDLAACVRALDRWSNRLYASRFLHRLKQRVRNQGKLHPDLYPPTGLDQVRSIWEFDDRFTAPLFGFGTAANYYATQSAKLFLDGIRVPTLAIHAGDDPMVPADIYLHPAFKTNPALELLLTRYGGHLGFLSKEKPRFWLDGVALDWMEGIVSCAEQTSSGLRLAKE